MENQNACGIAFITYRYLYMTKEHLFEAEF